VLAARADVNAADNGGWMPLFGAAFNGHAEIAGRLPTAGANVNVVSNGGHTPLCWAASQGHADVVGALARPGGDGRNDASPCSARAIDVQREGLRRGGEPRRRARCFPPSEEWPFGGLPKPAQGDPDQNCRTSWTSPNVRR